MKRPKPGSGGDAYREWYDSNGRLSDDQLVQIRSAADQWVCVGSDEPDEMVIMAVLRAATHYLWSLSADVNAFQRTEQYREAATEIRDLVATTCSEEEFAKRIGELDRLASQVIVGADQDSPDSYAIHESLIYLKQSTRERIRHIRQGVGRNHLREDAEWAARSLEQAAGRGRTRLAAEHAFARSLLAVWVQFTDHSVRPDQRLQEINDRPDWPWRDFVGSVGRAVNPEFNPAGACRAVYDDLPSIKTDGGVVQKDIRPLKLLFVRLPGAPKV